ncbi:isthmin isoform X2 [Monomorium pharaonis]|uniref:isthmin isoform X2 n=1 Tax=Monomorium pharaonis TaxID=307658 RepID=UPI00102E159B|nr:isthmin isoform X2 [Monomorium pharaonis]
MGIHKEYQPDANQRRNTVETSRICARAQIQNSMTTQDVECRADCTRSRDEASMTPDEEANDYERARSVYPSRVKRTKNPHRSRARSNARNSTRSRHSKGNANNAFRDAPHGGGLEPLLLKLIEALENNSRTDDEPEPMLNSSAVNDTSSFDDVDRCQKWLDNWHKIERAFPGSVDNLPACPCTYPNNVFYNNEIWDKRRQKNFRWRDVSHEKDRLAIYKPGATYCVQTLPSHESESAIVQHCCYDEKRKLLTRGSGAGTPYIVSPDISELLHDKIDLLPWRLCKGDFTRYNEVRIPNNGNNCKTNPDNEEYQHQVENAKNY